MDDDMGASDIGCHVGDVQTAHLDRLFTSGVRFTHFHPEPVDRAALFVPWRVTMSVPLALGVLMAAFDLTALPNSWGAHWEGLSDDDNAGPQVVGELGGAIAVSTIAW